MKDASSAHPTTRNRDVLLALDKLKGRLAEPKDAHVDGAERLSQSKKASTQEFALNSHSIGGEASSQLTSLTSQDLVDLPVKEEQQPIKEAYTAVLGRLEDAIVAAEEATPTSSTMGKAKLTGPLSLATEAEWEVLLQAAVRAPLLSR